MNTDSSRRAFLASGLALPAAGLVPATAEAAGDVPLRYRVLGKTGLKVTSVGYGCMITSDASVISRAVDVGINYFDTSRWYQKGNNERMVGAALGAGRKRIVLSTKVDAESKAEALKELEMSLTELKTDVIDIWYLHGKDEPGQITDGLLEAQRIAKQQGKVRFNGISTHKLPAIAQKVKSLSNVMDVILTTYNFTMDQAMEDALDLLHKENIGLVAMKVMAGGLRPKNPKPQLRRPGAMTAALRWVLKNPRIATTIPSMTDMDQLDQNLRVMTESFSAEDEQLLAARLEQIRPWFCRMCGACDGVCPKGLPVSDVVRYVMYAESYGQFSLGRERFQQLPAHLQAVRCGDCGTCAIRCRNGVQVAERVSRAQQLFA